MNNDHFNLKEEKELSTFLTTTNISIVNKF